MIPPTWATTLNKLPTKLKLVPICPWAMLPLFPLVAPLKALARLWPVLLMLVRVLVLVSPLPLQP